MKKVFMSAVLLSFILSGCFFKQDEKTDPCSGVLCNFHGTCRLDGNSEPYCECETGFFHDGENGEENILSCTTDTCDVVDCDYNGVCKLDENSEPYCECYVDYEYPLINYEPQKLSCVQARVPYDKPVIYLYPEQKTDVTVRFEREDQLELTYTYPLYSEDGWNVTAMPDGTLFDETGKEYYALYWEGFAPVYEVNSGFVVKGEDTVEFLEKILPRLGLTAREAQEFIIYWMPVLSESPYNFMHFSTKRWAESVPLKVVPAPDTSIRFMMLYKPLKRFVKVSPQIISAPERKGFVLVEWGGSKYTGLLK